MTLAGSLKTRYPHKSERSQLIRQRLEEACTAFINAGYGDSNATQKLCSADDSQYWQQLSEVLIASQLLKVDISIAHLRQGPDFVFENNGRRIWIEVICPEPRGIPNDWTNHIPGTAVSFPHEAILLRWTAAIKEKAEKLLGKPGVRGYLDKGIVGRGDAYVIAVNGRLLRGFGGVFPELAGISQFPFAVEATLAVGPLQVLIDRDTRKATESGYQHRPLIPKLKGDAVPADTFLSARYAPVSAVWAVDLDEMTLLGESRPTALVHNPHATNPIPGNLVPAASEYLAIDCGDYFQLERHDGRSVT
jgi:type I restriction enzyme S subunit